MARGYYSYVKSQPIHRIFLYHDEIVEKYTSGNCNWAKELVLDWLKNDLIMRIRVIKLAA